MTFTPPAGPEWDLTNIENAINTVDPAIGGYLQWLWDSADDTTKLILAGYICLITQANPLVVP